MTIDREELRRLCEAANPAGKYEDKSEFFVKARIVLPILLDALEEIARQKLHAEITDCDPDELDWLGGYEGCVKRARSAIAETAP